jgi:TetR/AcrR family tetracycline transcriptional repressor
MDDLVKTVGRPAPLDRETIVRTALSLLDREGMDGLSTRRLAAELGIKSASLYWHFKDKGELLSEMSGAMFKECLQPADPDNDAFDVFEWLASFARAIRRVALSRRDGAQVMSRAKTKTPQARAGLEANVKIIMRTGLSDMEARMALQTIRRYAIGAVMQEQSAPDGARNAGITVTTAESFEFGLQAILVGLHMRAGDRIEAKPPARKSRA